MFHVCYVMCFMLQWSPTDVSKHVWNSSLREVDWIIKKEHPRPGFPSSSFFFFFGVRQPTSTRQRNCCAWGWLGVSAKHLLPNSQERQHDKAVSWAKSGQIKFIPLPSWSIGNFIKRTVIHSCTVTRTTKTGQDSFLDKALDYRLKGTGFDLRLNHKRGSTWATNSFSMWHDKDPCWSFFNHFFIIWPRPVPAAAACVV
jgi:hypothetical protein